MRLTYRALVSHYGRHRAERPHGAAVDQKFVHCPECGVEIAAAQHGAVLRCAEGHLLTPGGAE